MAQQLAVGAEPCFEFLKLVKAGEQIWEYGSPTENKEWLKLYRDDRGLKRYLVEEFRKLGGVAEAGSNLFGLIVSRLRGMNDDNKRNSVIKAENKVKVCNFHLGDIQSDMSGEVDEGLSRKIKKALERAEIKFFFRIWIPCWFLYGDYPWRLFKRARVGEVDMIEKLLGLDTRILNDPKISEYLHDAKEKGKRRTLGRLAEALQKGPKSKITLKKVKYKIAGLISVISEILGDRLSEGEISALFHAVACDLGKEDGDPDIPDRDKTGAFAKAIQRERAFWIPIIQQDKK